MKETTTPLLAGIAALCFGCQDPEGVDPVAPSDHKEGNEHTMITEDWLRGMESRKEILEGSFEGIAIGQSKPEVFVSLKSIGASSVYPDVKEEVRVTRPADVEKLRSVDAIIIGSGSGRVELEGEDVVRISIPFEEGWKECLEGVENRQELFVALRTILLNYKDIVVRGVGRDSRHVWIKDPGQEGLDLLEQYDLWRVSYSNNEGYWGVLLEFDKDKLKRMIVDHSLVEGF